MSLLLIQLPAGDAAHYDYIASTDGRSPTAQGSGVPAALLPAAGRGVEVVALAPASRLAWQRVRLPKGLGPQSARLRPALSGLLEDRLLTEPQDLHFALAPDARGGDAPCWVAMCDRHWLQRHLHALEAAGRPVSRIVPEAAPQEGEPALTLTGDDARPLALLTGGAQEAGVLALPFTPAALALLPQDAAGLLPEDTAVQAEPAVAQLAERLLGGPVPLLPRAERLLLACRSRWDLAQMDLAAGSRARAGKRLLALGRAMWHERQWRPARWALALALIANLAGLNLWAWQERAQLHALREQTEATLTQTFPHVRLVVDAPLQMEREVAALRQASGTPAPGDMETLLAALGQAGQANPAAALPVPTSIEYESGQLSLHGLPPQAPALPALIAQLHSLGYQAEAQNEQLLLRPLPAEPAPAPALP